jgi:hypothetical protein
MKQASHTSSPLSIPIEKWVELSVDQPGLSHVLP